MTDSARFPLDADRLRRLLADAGARAVVVHDRIGSTNDEAWRLADLGSPGWTVVAADEQTAGRGRHGRSWLSSAGLGVYASALVRPWDGHRVPGRFTLAAAVAAAEACSAAGVRDEIEWPNDVVVRGLKLAGVLAESRSAGPLADAFVIGVGCNVHHRERDFPAELRTSATSLAIESAPVRDRERLVADWVGGLVELYGMLAGEGWRDVARRFLTSAAGAHGQRVRVEPSGAGGPGPFEGVTCGIDDLGLLLVRGDDGSVRSVHAAAAVRAPGSRPC
jgi:BirA family biotin operon repressor/biotin-[acetyl-CoA-carboxylase] ligase